MHEIKLPTTYNYIGAFLTFACELQCSYCLNYQWGAKPKYKQLSSEQWIKGLNRLDVPIDLPVTIQGGEPTLHPGFYKIISGIHKHISIDLLTNACFSLEEFLDKIPPERLRRRSKYASIRVSYHMEQMELAPLVDKVVALLKRHYHIGVWIVDHPRDRKMIKVAQRIMEKEGIDCRIKEFLGVYNDVLYGTYKYPAAVCGEVVSCMCKPSEMLISPDGSVHRCHHHLYNNVDAYAHVLDSHVKLLDSHMECKYLGSCNSCDIKLKTNRYQEFGHCSVDVKSVPRQLDNSS